MGGATLAIETAAADCSVALIADGALLAERTESVGRGHAERLAPMIAALMTGAGVERPGAILVDCGPGSFTGVRVGLATAIGLGLGWGVPVRGFSATAALAAAAFEDDPALAGCAVALAGGHGELFVERFTAPLTSIAPLASLAPAAAAGVTGDATVLGSGAAALVAARGSGRAIDRTVRAVDAAALPAAFILPARPIYGRAPDARVPGRVAA